MVELQTDQRGQLSRSDEQEQFRTAAACAIRTLYTSTGACDSSIIWYTRTVRASAFGLLEASMRRTRSVADIGRG